MNSGPLGTKYGSVSLGGAMWDVYQTEHRLERLLVRPPRQHHRLDTQAYSVDIG
ncbi:hypothetical protein ABZ896_40465 [Streptomyces sp. NPDC047072]|uniref:hypothetical protein n=1 Tax=Streptomyces sp. NPDC047072 TaxID=3154809 RepID=UPI0033D0DC87